MMQSCLSPRADPDDSYVSCGSFWLQMPQRCRAKQHNNAPEEWRRFFPNIFSLIMVFLLSVHHTRVLA
jgi:hypothetical protein